MPIPNLEFCQIRRTKFGRRWAIKEKGKIIHQGYDFSFGTDLFRKLQKEREVSKCPTS